MFTSDIIKQLKQVNISVDAEKSKVRIAGLWKNAPKKKREEVLSLADVALATVQRAYKTGSVSAKLTVPLAQTLNVNPAFITGESDSVDECTDERLRELLEKLGYTKLLAQYDEAERSRIRREKREAKKQAAENFEAPYSDEQPENETCCSSESDTKESDCGCAEQDGADALADALTEEDMALLLKSVLLRAKAGGKYAETAKKLKLLLLS